MRYLFAGIVIALVGYCTSAWSGVRTETGFNTFQACVTVDVVGQQAKAVVSGDIVLDNGGTSRRFGYDIMPFLSPGQRTQLRNDVLAMMQVVSAREDVPTPTPSPTPTFTSGGGQATVTPTRSPTPTITKTFTPGPTSTP